jgi:Flp pilus assembly protein TadG
VEFALVAPILLWLVFGLIDYGIWFADGMSIRDATRNAARAGALGSLSSAATCRNTQTGWSSPNQDYAARVACTALDNAELMGSRTSIKVKFAPVQNSGNLLRGDVITICVAIQQTVLLPLVPLPRGGVQYAKMSFPIEAQSLVNNNGSVPATAADSQNLPSGMQWSSWCG